MAYRLTNGAVFLHIPKTGGSWVEEVLRECDLVHSKIGHRHSTYERVLNHEKFLSSRRMLWRQGKRRIRNLLGVKPPPPDYRFCFVRNPLQWYESWWKFMKPRGWNSWGQEDCIWDWHPNANLNGIEDDDFNAFVRKVIRKRPGYVTELYSSYTQPRIDFIGRTENLVDDLLFLLDAQGLKYDEQKIKSYGRANVSDTPSDEICWDPELKRTVTLLELPAMLQFGYLSEEEAEDFGIHENLPPHRALRRATRQPENADALLR